jgi:L-threonylcarbamoyladenylate synthase
MINSFEETLIGNDVEQAAQLLAAGKLVAIPTETVYGLAGNIFSESAVKEIFKVKQRPATNPLIVHLPDVDSIHEIVKEIPAEAKILLAAFSPGPLTLLLPKNYSVPDIVTAGSPYVAIRIPDHELTLELLQKVSFPLVAPSANPYTYISPTSAMHVKKMLAGKIPYILDGGPCKMGLESTIVGFPNGTPTIYRMGSISREEIEDKIGKVKLVINGKAFAPGMHHKHYSPNTRLILSDNPDSDITHFSSYKIGLITYNNYSELLPSEQQLLLCENDDFKTAGANLYAAMHIMDNKGYDMIIARKFPETGIGSSINDRLNRAKEK